MLTWIRQAFVKAFWPTGFSSKAGRVLGGFALIALVSQVYSVGFGPVFTDLIGYYDRLIAVVLGWADPLILRLLAVLRLEEFPLYPHWRHVAVLMGIYYFRNAGVSFAAGAPATGTFRIVWGSLVVVAVSIATGISEPQAGAFWPNFLFAGAAISGFFAYRVGYQLWAASVLRKRWPETFEQPTDGWWPFVLHGVAADSVMAATGLLVAASLLLIAPIAQSPAPGLFVLLALILTLIVRFFLDARAVALRTRQAAETFNDAYWRTGSAQLAAAMLGVFTWAGTTVLLNVGFSFLGL